MDKIYRLSLINGESVYVYSVDKQGYPVDIFKCIKERSNDDSEFITLKNVDVNCHADNSNNSFLECGEVFVKLSSIVSIKEVYK